MEISTLESYVIGKFFQGEGGGVSDQNENLVGKFFARRAKKGTPAAAIFVVEALKTAKKP